MDKKVEQIILGSSCGDGRITKNNRLNSFFIEGHRINQQDYLIWKAKYVQKELNIRLWCENRFYKKKNQYKKEIYIRTNADKRLNKLHKLVYPTGKGYKVISMKLLNKLTWFGIAIWYLDDGCYSYQFPTGYINLHCNKLYLNNIIKFFKQKKFIFKKIKNRHGIRLNTKDSKRFIKKVKPYIKKMPKNMWYKLGNDKIKLNKSKLWLKKNRIKHLEYGHNYRQQLIKK